MGSVHEEHEETVENVARGPLVMSPSSLATFNGCSAGYVIKYHVLPRIEFEDLRARVETGSIFHSVAEHNFDPQVMEDLLRQESSQLRKDVEKYAKRVQSREYYTYPAVNERELRVRIDNLGILLGYPDRVVTYPDRRVKIVDYKTTAWPNMVKDLQQVLSYAFMVHLLDNIDPERITVVLDYVQTNEVREYTLSDWELKRHENLLRGTFARATSILREFERKGRDLWRLYYTPGPSCSFCPVTGICPAYHLVASPVTDQTSPAEMTVEEILNELATREPIATQYAKRIEILKRALLLRATAGENAKEMEERIREERSIVRSSVSEISSRAFLAQLVPSAVKRAVKGHVGASSIDTQVIEKKVIEALETVLPDMIAADNVPDEYAKKLKDKIVTKQRAPYLRQKS